MQLQKGEKRSLVDLGVASRFTVKVDFGLDGVDIAAFGLNQEGKIGDDRYVVLYSNTRSPEGAVELIANTDTAAFTIDLDKLPTTINRVVFTATHESQPISAARPLVVSIDGKVTFDVANSLSDEKAVMMIEIYRHAAGWKVGAIAAGFAGGLAALIEHFGGEVAAAKAGTPPPPPPPAPPPAAKPVSLAKITLEKSKPSVSLKKTGSSFGEIVLNLNWNANTGKRGFFGGGPKPLDLDLGVLFELQDGRKGVIQALGRQFGSYQNEPWIELSGDDRTGNVAAGETIRVNGSMFDRIKRIAVFALIYDGAPNWQQTDGVVRMNIPGQPEIELRMDEGRNDRRLCGIALIDNAGGEMRVTRHMKYYSNQKPFADDIGIIMRWVAGTKD